MKRMRVVAGVMMAMAAAVVFGQGAAVPSAPETMPATTRPLPKPILPGHTADPDVRVFGDTYYIYPTSDKDQWLTTDFSVFSSKDLIHWKNEGMILDVTKELAWAKLRAWAPGTIERDGKYYFYFCADAKIGVGVADKPTGPFKDALGKPLVAALPQRGGQAIDPCPFIDEDGQAYLYYGNGRLFVQKLAKDMISFDGEAKPITPRQFREGIFVFKRKGTYYFMWSVDDARSDNYRVAWGTGTSPLGPIVLPEGNNVILKKEGIIKGTGHHSVVNVPGTDRWYIVYHRHAIPNGNGYTRETCLSKMEFSEDGKILPVDVWAPAFPEGSKGEPITK